MEERFNAVPNGDSYNCPRCYRTRSLVLIRRAGALWQCGAEGTEGCYGQFRLEASAGVNADTLVRVRASEPVRQTPEEFAAKRARFQP